MKRQVFLSIALLAIISFFQTPREPGQAAVKEGEILVPASEDRKIELTLEAKSVFILEAADNKVLYEKNSKDVRPLASLTKLMTSLISEERLSSGERILITKEAILQPENEGLLEGDMISKNGALDIMMAASSNDTAYAVGEHIGGNIEAFSSLMNDQARVLGLSSLNFSNPHGLDIVTSSGRIPGAVGNAQDIAKLAVHIYNAYPKLFEKTRVGEFDINFDSGNVVRAKNTNEARDDIPNLIGAKTGYTTLAGGNLVFIFEPAPGRVVVVSILGSSEKGRFEDAKRIVGAVLGYYR